MLSSLPQMNHTFADASCVRSGQEEESAPSIPEKPDLFQETLKSCQSRDDPMMAGFKDRYLSSDFLKTQLVCILFCKH